PLGRGGVAARFGPLRHPLRDPGKRFAVEILGKSVEARAVEVIGYGNAPLFLLEPIAPEDRWITRRLYGGGTVDRVAQEVLLGIGGVRALRALGIQVDVYHFNEGHAVLGGVELIRERMARMEDEPGARLVEDRFALAWREVR